MTFTVERIVPVLRIFDRRRAHDFYVAVTGVRELHAELAAKDYPFLRPGLESSPGVDAGFCLTLLDPFGTTLRLDERPGRGNA